MMILKLVKLIPFAPKELFSAHTLDFLSSVAMLRTRKNLRMDKKQPHFDLKPKV